MNSSGSRRPATKKPRRSVATQRQSEPEVVFERGPWDVWQYSDRQQLQTVKNLINELMTSKAEAEAQIEECIKEMAHEQEMLDAYLASGNRPTEAEALGRKACRLGIKASKASIKAFRLDIGNYRAEIDALTGTVAADLLEFLPEDRELPDYPQIALQELPEVLEMLSDGPGYPRFAVLMFLPGDATDGEYVNLQYSVENNSVGLDWVLLGDRNRHDKRKVIALARRLGHEFIEYEMNGVKYLRIAGPALATLADLGLKLLHEGYGLGPAANVELLVQGFPWKAKNRELQSISLSELFGDQVKQLSADLAKREIPQNRPESASSRNILRLMGMVHELHKQGWQKIRIHSGLSASGCYWRCAIFADGLKPSQQAKYYKKIGPANLVAHYTTGLDRQYFEWPDCEHDTARQLAQKFLERFPRICELGRGRDWAYAGWFSELLGHAELGRFPLSYWDGMSEDADQAVWLSFGEEVPFPLPPPLGRETNFWPTALI